MENEIDETHDPKLRSWVTSANADTDFPIQNLPFGVFSRPGEAPRGGVAIGDQIVELDAVQAAGLLEGSADIAARAASEENLNALLALGPEPRRALRRRLSQLLSESGAKASFGDFLRPARDCTMLLPAKIGDFSDFFAGIHHALNCLKLFDVHTPWPNYKYLPIAYHGRASSIRASGTPVRRPMGQFPLEGETQPTFRNTQTLDFELEIGVWIGEGNDLGDPISIDKADRHVAGLCLLNDWSARDIQFWEGQPNGPFLGKSFMSSISPWIVTAEALAPFRIAQPSRPKEDPAPLPHLFSEADQRSGSYSIEVKAFLRSNLMRKKDIAAHQLTVSEVSSLYWTAAQMIAHHTSGGCSLNPGDLLGTGTVSNDKDNGKGCLLEISYHGKQALVLPSGEERTYLEDGDEVALTARAHAEGFVSIGFGECAGLVRPR